MGVKDSVDACVDEFVIVVAPRLGVVVQTCNALSIASQVTFTPLASLFPFKVSIGGSCD
jgi:hypothetical protein